MFWSRSFRIVLISILINDYLQIALRLIKDYLSGFWSFGICRRHAFLFFCSSVGAEASFLSFFGFRHLPKTCFPDFHSVGRCRSSVFWIFSFSAPAEELFFRFSLRRWVPKRCFSIRSERMGGHLQYKTVYSCHEQTLMYVYLGIFGQ